MCHLPFTYRDQEYTGLAPGASYYIVPFDSIEPDKLKRAIEWVIANQQKHNLRIIQNAGSHMDKDFLNHGEGLLRNTSQFAFVQALRPAVAAGILVVEHNGNSAVTINLPPIEYLAVGAYQDNGKFEPSANQDNPDEPFGRNGDVHYRPDIRAPRFKVINHIGSDGQPGYYGGTSCASAQMAGLCANLWSMFPNLDAKTLKSAIVQSGMLLPKSPNCSPIANADAAIKLLKNGLVHPLPTPVQTIKLTDWRKQLESVDEIERALAISRLAELGNKSPLSPEEQSILRQRLLSDLSPIVRITALQLDHGDMSKAALSANLWRLIKKDPHPGVRGWCAMSLANGMWDEYADWEDILLLLYDPNWSVRWSVNRAWNRRFPAGPKFIIAGTPEDVKPTADKLIALSYQTITQKQGQ